MSIVVVGSTGQLATHLREFLPDATYLDRSSLDLSDSARVGATLDAIRPRALVNAAGYTSVDKAESERELAWRVNAESVAAMARVAGTLEIPFVHVSSDYIFDGRKTAEYEENDPAAPLGVYGATKLVGEIAARTLSRKSWILRVSWVFSEHGANFVKTILRLAATRSSLSVVADQRGRPTYARDVADLIARLVGRPETQEPLPFGTYHATGGAIVSWYEFAQAIIEGAFRRELIGTQIPVLAIPTSEYPTPAKRPANSALRPSAQLSQVLGTQMDWRPGLDHVLDRLV